MYRETLSSKQSSEKFYCVPVCHAGDKITNRAHSFDFGPTIIHFSKIVWQQRFPTWPMNCSKELLYNVAAPIFNNLHFRGSNNCVIR